MKPTAESAALRNARTCNEFLSVSACRAATVDCGKSDALLSMNSGAENCLIERNVLGKEDHVDALVPSAKILSGISYIRRKMERLV